MNPTEKTKRYEIVKPLGEGAFASVFLAKDKKLERDVAIKAFKLADAPEQLARFNREIQICRHLRHPNIVRIYDASTAKESPHIVMEYVNGDSLLDLIKTTPLSVDRIISLSTQVATALSYLHSEGILHRDIKPANIMVEDANRAILMDFNLASSEDLTVITREGFAVGTPRYMAPEILVGEPASEQSDIYSLGMVLHDMLTTMAVPTEEVMPLTADFEGIQPPSYYVENVPPELDALVNEMTQQDPLHRPASADQLLRRLEELNEHPTKSQKSRKPLKPRKKRKPQTPANLKTVAVPPARDSDDSGKSHSHAVKALVCVCGLILAFASGYFARSFKPTSNSSGEESTQLSPLLELTREFSQPLLSCKKLVALRNGEEEQYKRAQATNETGKHYDALKQAVGESPKEGALRPYLEYLYRSRQGSRKQSHDRRPQQALIFQSTMTYLKHLAGAQTASQEEIESAIFLVSTLFSEIQDDLTRLADTVQALTTHYHELTETVKKSSAGKSLLHSIALARIFLQSSDTSSLPVSPETFAAMKRLFSIETSYETPTVKEIRRLFSLPPVNVDIENDRKLFLIETERFHKRAVENQVSIRARINENFSDLNFRNFAQRQRDGETPLFNEYLNLLKEYDFYLSYCWYQLRLDDSPSRWSEPVLLSCRGLITSFGVISSLFVSRSEPPQTGPGSRDHAATTIPLFYDGVLSVSFKNPLKAQRLVLTQVNNLVRWESHFTKEPVKDDLLKLAETIEKQSEETASCMKFIIDPGDNSASLDELEKLHQYFLKESETLTKKTFKRWTIGCSIVANRYLTALKETGNTRQRYEKALEVMNVLLRFPDIELYFATTKIPGFYCGPASLQRVAFFHVLDTANELNIDFAKEHKQLDATLKVTHILTSWSTALERAHLQSGSLSATRLLKRETLPLESFWFNPLNI